MKGRQLSAKVGVFIKYKRSSVKNNFCLAAVGIAVKHGQPVLYHIGFDGGFSVFIVCVVEWRSRDIDHHVGLLFHQLIHGANAVQWIIAEVPNVLTNGKGNAFSFVGDYVPFVCRFKITVLIKYIVSGQAGFVGNVLYLFVGQKISGIEKIFAFFIFVFIGCPNDDGDAVGILLYFINGLVAFIDKIIKLQEISWRIAAHTEFAEYNNIAALLFCFLCCTNYFLCVAFKISDVIVLLC